MGGRSNHHEPQLSASFEVDAGWFYQVLLPTDVVELKLFGQWCG